MIPMKAMILAAGLGTRLRPLTKTLPKPLIPIKNRPLIYYGLDLIKRAGVDEVVINLHYLGDLIEKELGDGRKLGLKITYSREQELLGTGGGIKAAEKFLSGESFLVLNCDLLTDLDLKEVIRFHQGKQAIATMVLRPNPGQYTKLGIDDDYRVLKIGQLVDQAVGLIDDRYMFAGIQVFEPEIFDYLELKFSSIIDADVRLIKNCEPIFGYVFDGRWEDVGDLEDYKKLN